MTLEELSETYREAAKPLRERLKQLRMKRLEKEIAYSSVTVNLQLPSYVDKPDSSQTLKEKFLGIGKNLKVAFAYIGLGLIYGIAVGGPFILAALVIVLIVHAAKKKHKKKK